MVLEIDSTGFWIELLLTLAATKLQLSGGMSEKTEPRYR